MSPPAKMPGWPVIMALFTLDDTVVGFDAGDALQQREVGVLPHRKDEGIGFELLHVAGRLREAFLVQGHLLDEQLSLFGVLDGGQPPHLHAFFQRLLDLGVMGRHPVAGPPVHDDGVFGAESPRRAGDVHRGVPAADDSDAPAEHRLVQTLHAAQHGHGIEDFARVAGRDVGPPADVRADGEERGVEAAGLHLLRTL